MHLLTHQKMNATEPKEELMMKSSLCPQCNKRFSTPYEAKKHLLAVHEKIREFKCDICSYTSSKKNHMMRHRQRVHKSELWLIQNYETVEGVSLPRSTLYSHYQGHCAETKQEPVDVARFGKLIRSVFLGLQTRRLGTRGNSRYHYCGIRVKPTSILNQIEDPKDQQQACQAAHYNGLQSTGASYQTLQVCTYKNPFLCMCTMYIP